MNTLALLGMSGGNELLIVLAVIALLFGSRRLPELSRALGKSLSEFRNGQNEGERPDLAEAEEDD